MRGSQPRKRHTRDDVRLAAFVNRAYRNAPAVKQMFDGVGLKPTLIKGVADLERVPILRKDALIQLQREQPPFGGLLAKPAQKKLRHIFQSPGPLNEPDAGDEAIILTAAAAFKDMGITKSDVVLNTFSYHLSPAGLHLVDEPLMRIGAVVVPSGVGNTDLQVQLMHELQATAFMGTPSFLMTLLRRAEELSLCEGLALHTAVFMAEPYPPSLRHQFETGYGLRTNDAYGTAELGVVAYSCEAKSGWHVAANIIVEIVDPTTGQQVERGAQGEVVVTTFNESYPLIRFGTGDLSAFATEPCSCGRMSLKLVGWLGRAGEAVKVRGMFVHPNQLKQAAARFPSIAKIQGVVTRPDVRDYFVVRVESSERNIESDLKDAVQNLCRVSVDEVQFVRAGGLGDGTRGMLDERKWE